MRCPQLTTNAVKHGALSSAAGRVEVDWTVDGQGDGAVLTIDWCEKDGPKVEAAPTLGFGSRLPRRTITKELAGELYFRFAPGGVCCKIVIPLGTWERQAA